MTPSCAFIAHILASASTPLPVVVQNFPGPDRVATDTLYWAKAAVVVTVALGIPALLFGVVEFWLNTRQFRTPRLAVSFVPGPNTVLDEHLNVSVQPISQSGYGRNYVFEISLRVSNSGARAATGCFVAVWVPARLGPAPFGNGWTTIDKSNRSVWGKPKGEYQCHETFIDKPVFLDHAVILRALTLQSEDGVALFELYWQVFDEFGKRESTRQTPFTVSVGSGNQ